MVLLGLVMGLLGDTIPGRLIMGTGGYVFVDRHVFALCSGYDCAAFDWCPLVRAMPSATYLSTLQQFQELVRIMAMYGPSCERSLVIR